MHYRIQDNTTGLYFGVSVKGIVDKDDTKNCKIESLVVSQRSQTVHVPLEYLKGRGQRVVDGTYKDLW
jgi:hypothetical protein